MQLKVPFGAELVQHLVEENSFLELEGVHQEEKSE